MNLHRLHIPVPAYPLLMLLFILLFYIWVRYGGLPQLPVRASEQTASSSLALGSIEASGTPMHLLYTFNAPGVLEEAGTAPESTSAFWWLNSGGELEISDGTGQTVQGDMAISNHWRTLYNFTNPTDTDGGTHPQNIFRLVSRTPWENVGMEASMRITGDHRSSSFNRNASNGLLLMSHYQDGNTLYYAGIRVDGTAVIKKKYHGTYYTLAQRMFLPGTYNPVNSPNLLPHNEWIGIRSETRTTGDVVTITLFIRREGATDWTPLLSATDTGAYGGTMPITEKGYVGIRTDFMDVQFSSIRIDDLDS